MDKNTKSTLFLLAAAFAVAVVIGYNLVAAANRLLEHQPQYQAPLVPQPARQTAPAPAIDGRTPDEQMMDRVAKAIQQDVKDLK